MITPFLRGSELIEDLRPLFSRHRDEVYKIITSPFVLWMTLKEYLALSESELNIDSIPLRGFIDLNKSRNFCVEFLFGFGNLDTVFSMLATLELDRRLNPEDPSKEITFCNYAPSNSEDPKGSFYDETAAHRASLAAEAAPAATPEPAAAELAGY